MRYAPLAVAVCLLLTAGCGSLTSAPATDATATPGGSTAHVVAPDQSTATEPGTVVDGRSPAAGPSPEDRTAGPTSADLTASGVSCAGSPQVGLWRVSDEYWERDAVRFSASVPPNASLLVVAFVDGAFAGATHQRNAATDPVALDGGEIELDEPVSGERDVRFVVYRDEDGDERFDAGVDRPCLHDDRPVQAGPTTVNFSAIG